MRQKGVGGEKVEDERVGNERVGNEKVGDDSIGDEREGKVMLGNESRRRSIGWRHFERWDTRGRGVVRREVKTMRRRGGGGTWARR